MATITPEHQAAVVALYTALFNRAPDADGLAFWTQAYANGASLDTISQGFVASPESNALYPASQTDTQFVTAFYMTVFGRAPDPEGLAFWLASLSNLGGAGSPSARAGLVNQITTVVNTPMTQKPAGMSDADYQRTLNDRGTFANKNAVGIDFAVNLKSNDVDLAKKVTSVVTNDPASIESAKTVAQTGVVPPTAPPSTGGGTVTPPVDIATFDLDYKAVTAVKDAALYAGTGNPASGFVVATNKTLGLELGLDVRYAGDLTDVSSVNGTGGRFLVDVTKADAVRFAYSVSTTDGKALDTSAYDFRLVIDTDAAAVNTTAPVTFTLAPGGGTGTKNVSNSDYQWLRAGGNGTGSITDDGGNAAVTQNIQKIQWYASAGTTMTLGAQHNVTLQAFTKTGVKVAESAITIDVAPLTYTQSFGNLDAAAVKDGFLHAGTGNPATGFVLSTNTDAKLQLGLDVRKTQDLNELPVQQDGKTFHVATADAASARFAYSVASTNGTLDLAKYDVKLKIDTDKSDDTNFLTFNLVGKTPVGNSSSFQWVREGGTAAGQNITDDGGTAGVTQNIQAIHWYANGGTATPGSYAVELSAYVHGTTTLVAQSEIIMLIGDIIQ